MHTIITVIITIFINNLRFLAPKPLH